MSFRKIDRTQWEAVSLLRDACDIDPGFVIGLKTFWKYWVCRRAALHDDTACIKLCADRGDPFAKRLWARIIAARLAK